MKFQKRPQSESLVGNNFLKVKDGESVNVIPRGEIYEYYVKWEGGKSHVVARDEGGKVRYRVNVVVKEDDKLVAKIWEFGVPVYDQLAAINEEYDVTRTKIKVTRHGEKLDTTYMLLPLLKEPISEAMLKTIGGIDLHILEPKTSKPVSKSQMEDFGDVPMPDEENLPF